MITQGEVGSTIGQKIIAYLNAPSVAYVILECFLTVLSEVKIEVLLLALLDINRMGVVCNLLRGDGVDAQGPRLGGGEGAGGGEEHTGTAGGAHHPRGVS